MKTKTRCRYCNAELNDVLNGVNHSCPNKVLTKLWKTKPILKKQTHKRRYRNKKIYKSL